MSLGKNKESFSRVQTTVKNCIDSQVEVLAEREVRKKGTMYRVLILEALKARAEVLASKILSNKK
jgi:hypothetical protein